MSFPHAPERDIEIRHLTELMNKRRQVLRVNLRVCETGHVVGIFDKGEQAWEILHDRCGRWTFEDGTYCGNCGGRV